MYAWLGCVYAHDVNFVVRTVYARTVRAPPAFFFLNSAYNANTAFTCTLDSFFSSFSVCPQGVNTEPGCCFSVEKEIEDTELEQQTTEDGKNDKRPH